MFKVNIVNPSQNLSWGASFSTELEAQEWLAQQIGKPHRLPERQVPLYDGNGLPLLDQNNEPVMGALPAEFTSEIVDLSLDANYVNEEIREKRKREYPSVESVIEALMEEVEGRPEKLTEILMDRAEIKLKYPKPINQGN
jgi:hypothetical protein